ncbi:unnamed protein product [Schistosoma mattheei]|uniref:Uncharacterized protein n=1 Tax=Schistosoma mattheei TaxID=31246 RepID=A0A183NVL3_9TREM|nr:unnamed protein product [Schistosoma mattheei]
MTQAGYTKESKRVKVSNRADERNYLEHLSTTTEKAAEEGDMKESYTATKKLSSKYSKPKRPVKTKGKPTTEV